MRYPASYIKSIYARYASLTVHHFLIYYAISRIICERILCYVIEAPIMVIEAPIMVIEVSYNYYLTLFAIIFYKLRNYYSFSKNFYNFIFSKKL